jgi:hypothetical protein
VTGVAVNVSAIGVTVHMTSPAVNAIMGLRRHRFYSTRVALMSAVDGLGWE